MVKVRIVSLKELSDSPTLCLSPLRQFGECHRCRVFWIGLRKRRDLPECGE